MNIEENRLQTFNDWPADAAVSAVRIAKAGFFSVHQGVTVKCFSCGLEISEWNYGDQVMARHRQLSPTCAFVLDPSTSGNVPKISQPPSRTESIAVPSEDAVDAPQNSSSLMHEAVRLQSFENWPVPHIVSPESLARAGFYYLRQRDKTKCIYCGGIVVAWEAGDDPDREHKRHFPNCPFVQTVITPRLDHVEGEDLRNLGPNVSSPSFTNLNIVSQDNLRELGVNEHKGPKKSKYATLESRLRTFATWPEDLVQTPDALAQAGFYYEGSGDQVRCFHCDGGLRHWDPHDDPWTEHARWFPKCAYVLLIKGQDFISACAFETDVTSSTEQESRRLTRSAPIHRREITDRDIQAQMLTPQVIAALNVGLHVGRIRQAIREKLEQTGTGFSTADAVIEAALNLQRDEEETIDTHISQQVTRILADTVHQLHSNEGHSSEYETRRVQSEPPRMPSEIPVLPSEIPVAPSEPPRLQPEASVGNSSNAAAAVPEKPLSLEEENRLLKEARLCKICMDNEVGIVFLPCGHLATCVNCAPNLQDCPVCRSTIKATVRTFLS